MKESAFGLTVRQIIRGIYPDDRVITVHRDFECINVSEIGEERLQDNVVNNRAYDRCQYRTRGNAPPSFARV